MFSAHQNIDLAINNIIKYMTAPEVIFSILKAIFILAAALALVKFGNLFISKSVKVLVGKKTGTKSKIPRERITTLTEVFNSFFTLLVWTTALLTILSEFKVNIAPILASLGIVGLALSMGAKNLIQDYLSGIVILLEDQYRIGEKVELAGKTGEVKEINLRRTILFNPEDKKTCYIPNSEVKTVVNLSRDIS
jgi:small-conductance mechanosensitive channel